MLRYSAAFVEEEYNILNHLFWWCSQYNKFLKGINVKWTDEVGSIKCGEDWCIILFSKLASWFICYLNLTSLSHMRITGNFAWAMKMYGNNINEFQHDVSSELLRNRHHVDRIFVIQTRSNVRLGNQKRKHLFFHLIQLYLLSFV